jgi:DNA-binding NtrC family response regulator
MIKNKKVLIIEDEDAIRQMLTSMLETEGVRVVASLDLKEIEQLVPQVDVVLSDYNMGLDFKAVKLLVETKGKPLLLMSGNPDAELCHSRFIPKPFAFQDMVQALSALVA